MRTRLGTYLRELRIKHHEILSDMAEKLEVKIPLLSVVENGKKPMPERWITILVERYQLNAKEAEKLKVLAEESKSTYKLDCMEVPLEKRELAALLSKKFAALDQKTTFKIIDILKGVKDDQTDVCINNTNLSGISNRESNHSVEVEKTTCSCNA